MWVRIRIGGKFSPGERDGLVSALAGLGVDDPLKGMTGAASGLVAYAWSGPATPAAFEQVTLILEDVMTAAWRLEISEAEGKGWREIRLRRGDMGWRKSARWIEIPDRPPSVPIDTLIDCLEERDSPLNGTFELLGQALRNTSRSDIPELVI